jgi:hypothetical protein
MAKAAGLHRIGILMVVATAADRPFWRDKEYYWCNLSLIILAESSNRLNIHCQFINICFVTVTIPATFSLSNFMQQLFPHFV